MPARVRLLASLCGSLLSVQALAQGALELERASTNNSVVGTIIHDTWDPGDPLTISGNLRDGDDNCATTFPATYVDSLILRILRPVAPEITGQGHQLCGDTPYRKGVAPGTNSVGDFSITIRGGGVSYYTYHADYRGAVMRFRFKNNSGVGSWRVHGGTVTRWPEYFACSNAPDIYGLLASPDLTGDLIVDSADISAFAAMLGEKITREDNWQADFNHQGPTVDASDLSYFAGRIGKSCSSQKAGSGDFQMDVTNLQREDVQQLMASAGLNALHVIAEWDAMGFSYDREAATLIASAVRPLAGESKNWTSVKRLFR